MGGNKTCRKGREVEKVPRPEFKSVFIELTIMMRSSPLKSAVALISSNLVGRPSTAGMLENLMVVPY